MNQNVKTSLKYVGYALVFLFSFIFFIYLTFPYGVLKEALRSQISAETGMDIRINSLSPRLLLGMKAEGVEIRPKGSEAVLALKTVSANISLLSLLVGNLGLGFDVEENLGGRLNVGLGLGLFSLIAGNPLPSSVKLSSENFALDSIAKFALTYLSDDPNTNPLVGPLLKKIGVSGKLAGKVNFKLDSSDPSKSSGQADLKINQAALKLNDPSLSLPDQNFTKAQLKAGLDSGELVIDSISGFTAPELDLAFKGKIAVKATIPSSVLDIIIGIKLDNNLKNQFGFIIDAMTGQTRNGEVSLQIRGPLADPTVTKF